MNGLEQQIFQISNEEEFVQLALEVYKFQSSNNTVYREFVQ